MAIPKLPARMPAKTTTAARGGAQQGGGGFEMPDMGGGGDAGPAPNLSGQGPSVSENFQKSLKEVTQGRDSSAWLTESTEAAEKVSQEVTG